MKPLLPEGCRQRACELISEYQARGLSEPTVRYEAYVKLKQEFDKLTSDQAMILIQFYQDAKARGMI